MHCKLDVYKKIACKKGQNKKKTCKPYKVFHTSFLLKIACKKGQNKKKTCKPYKVFHTSFLLKKFTTKPVDEDPVVCQRWISRKQISSAKILRTKNDL